VRDDLLAKKGLIININYTLIMQCLNFAVLLLVLYAWLWDPMLRFLDKRRALVKERLDEAAASREEAAGLRDQRQQELGKLRQERGQIIEQAKALGEQERDEIVERARREAERIMRQTEERLGEESRRARVALREEVAELATYIASRMLKREISQQDHDRLIEEVTQGMALDAREGRPEAGGSE
jgi:F-type H+-transporting ATPase subunit b